MSNGTLIKRQTSDTFLLSAILSFSGGLQDAYTYFLRNKVFANAQTGNVVLMSHYFMKGDWKEGIEYLAPLFAFAFGVIIAEHIGHKYKSNRIIHWRQIVLFLETIILFVVGFIPERYNMLASALVSLACAMQVEAFKTVHGYGYASTMCIGNLRCGMESLSMCIRDKDKEALVRVYYYYGIIITFAIGAGIGGISSDIMEMKTIWISCVLLIICCLLMIKKRSIFHKSCKNKNKKNEKLQYISNNVNSNVKYVKETSLNRNVYVDIDIDDNISNTNNNAYTDIGNNANTSYSNKNNNIPNEIIDNIIQTDFSIVQSDISNDIIKNDSLIIHSIIDPKIIPNDNSTISYYSITDENMIQNDNTIVHSCLSNENNNNTNDCTIIHNMSNYNNYNNNNSSNTLQNDNFSIIKNIETNISQNDNLTIKNIDVNNTLEINKVGIGDDNLNI